MAFGGTALKLVQTVLYALEFCCAAVILALYSYFLSVLSIRDLPISNWLKAVEGLSGAAVLYTIFAVLLTCCLGGKMFFAFLGIVLDVVFCGAMIAIAVMTRDGASSCSGDVDTPLGSGPEGSKEGFTTNGNDRATYTVSLGTACTMNTVCFAVAVIAAFLFPISALVQLALGRHHKKEKRFGPSPSNNYTRGSGIKFWQRRRKNHGALPDPEMTGANRSSLAPSAAHDVRPSHDTAYTGSTVAAGGYENPNKPLVGGYHTAPTGTYRSPATNY